MTNVEFSHDELDLLREVIEQAVHEVETEISRADSIDFKHMLKLRKEGMEHILRKLEEVPASM